MSKIKKSISVFTSITTILWLSGIAMLVPVSVGAADIIDGDIMRNPNAEGMAQFDIYIAKHVGDKKFKRLILSPHVFESYGHLEWGNVELVDQATMDAYTTSELVREINDTKVYKLIPDGDTGTKQHLNMTAADFTSEGYDWDSIYIINSTDRDAYTTGSDLTVGEEEEEEVVSEGTLTVALAADTPAAAIAVSSAARVPFTKINLTATGGDVIVDSLTMQRTGLVAQDGAFSSLCVIDVESNEKIGLDKTLNSSHQGVLNDDITVSSGTTKSIMLAGNMGTIGTTYAGEVPTLSLVAMTLKGDATLNATLPIAGNAMTLNGTITIATVTLGEGASNPGSDSTPKVGETDVDFTEIKISNTSSAEIVEVSQIKFTQYGSAGDSDVVNFDFVNSGTNEVLKTIEKMDADKELVITLDSPIEIGKGKNKSFMLRGDIEGGAARTVQMKIEKFTDLLVKGQLYGYYITPTAGTNARTTEPVFGADTVVYVHTIGQGSLKVSQAALAASNIAEGGSQVVLGAFDFVCKGEDVTISSAGWTTHIDQLTAGTGATTSDITNLTVYDEDGNTIAGPSDPVHKHGDGDEAYGTATTTDSFTVPIGTTTYTVKADLSTDFSANDTIDVRVIPGIFTAKGDVTGKTVTPTPATEVTSVTQTVKTSTLAVSLDPSVATASVVKGTTGYTFAKVVIDASGSGEAINVTQVLVRVEPASASANELSNFALYDGDTELAVTNDPDSGLSATAATKSTSTFTLSDTLVVSKGATKKLTVKADISRDCSANDTFKVGISTSNVVGTGADTGDSVSPTYSASDGNAQTIQDTGSLTIYASSATPKSGLITANTGKVTVGVMSVTAKYEDVNIEKVYLTAAQVSSKGGWDQVETVYLYDGSDYWSATPTSTDAANRTTLIDMTATPLKIAKGASKEITVKVDTSPADRFAELGPGMAGQGFNLKINAVGDVTAKGVSSGAALAAGSKTVSCNMKEFTVYKSVPTVSYNEDVSGGVASGDLTSGTETGKALYKFKVSADSKGSIALYQVSFLVTTSTATVTQFYLYDGTSKVAATTTFATSTTAAERHGAWVVEFVFTDDGLVPSTDNTNIVPYTIAAGDSETFTFKANVECDSKCQSTATPGSVQIQFLADGAFPGTYPDNATTLEALQFEADFIWGDLNVTGNTASTTASTSEQWTNAYRVASAGGGKLIATSTAVIFTH